MAKSIIFSAVLIASLIFLVSVAEGQLTEVRITDANGKVRWMKHYTDTTRHSDTTNYWKKHAPSPSPSNLECNKVHGVVSGDTCYDVAKKANLSLTSFGGINPNLNCNKLFIGQWLCVDGITGA